MTKPVVLSVAATDGSGHAGLLADLRVSADLQLHGAALITGITRQNSQHYVDAEAQTVGQLQQQWTVLQQDLQPAAIKIGMLFSPDQANWLAATLAGETACCIWDPVLRASLDRHHDQPDEQWHHAARLLIARCDLITPNLPEAEWLLQTALDSPQAVEQAAQSLHALGARAVLIKGGHAPSAARVADYFYSDSFRGWLSQPRLDAPHHRGTGCVLASAIAAFVAHGRSLADAAVLGNAYVHRGLQRGFAVGQGAGLLANAGWPLDYADFPAVSDASGYQVPAAFADCGSLSLGLYPVVDSVDWVEKLLPLGVETLQLRIKDLAADALDQAVAAATALARRFNARLFINDYWQLAIKHGAYGVHLGQEDLDSADLEAIRCAGVRLGLSTHNEFEFARAAALRPSYLALGAVFPTDTKPVQVIGEDNLQRWVTTLGRHFPLTAIGGINADNIDRILQTGVGSVALVSAITKAADYQLATRTLLDKFTQTPA